MRIEKLRVVKNKIPYEGEIVWPDSLADAITLIGELETWEAFKVGYKELIKKRITGQSIRPRRKVVRIDLSLLDEQTRIALEQIVQWQADRQQQQQAAENAPPPEPQTDQTDSAEMPEEDSDATSEHGRQFEEDFAKYLAALGS